MSENVSNDIDVTEKRSDGLDGEPGLAARCIAALLVRHGIPKYRHAVTVSEILGLSYSAANRRLTMNASCSLEELTQIAAHFGETLEELISLDTTDALIDASIVINSHIVPCRIRLGNAVGQVPPGTLIATEIDGAWRVMPSDAKSTIPAHAVTRLLIEPTNSRRRVAVLDDHVDTAETIVRYMETSGLDAVAFNDPQDLCDQSGFDAYVLDWIIERDARRQTVLELVEKIRTRNARCPIIILTGQIRTGNADEANIAAALARHDLKFFTKPASMPILVAALNASFKSA
ncbi:MULTISPECIES: helix-turn-helix domain-containing protein [Rhizobium]|uniref:Helix-turn-helix domain-containing protein n=1 Tax=Rhizobium tumorigenes TaxID=2041385 RepID=A0AAF1KN22_9HYPH|nr:MULTISPECIES: helix-turn-helix domain-containing protein [Rhizobium]MBO9102001.1 response regulator [Rhizobium sp. L58/93]MBO9172194.1 response regulator [Rhizobium sp. L245/93]MBO9187932.1 response regulator [Rhizobium sp. E27B/91]QXZ87610.1 response regulator [Rhizobium sp. K1/93]QXZ93651.1 response regulator [Rhizobium sp. K15/93]